jgi:broad specificity phosphatase PhoE
MWATSRGHRSRITAHGSGPHARDAPFPNGESLHAAARRYGRALQALLARPERAILVVTHEIRVRYLLNAARASADLDSPHSRIANATRYCFSEDRLAAAAEGLATGYRGTR